MNEVGTGSIEEVMSDKRESQEASADLVEDAKQALINSIDEIGQERHEFASQAQWRNNFV